MTRIISGSARGRRIAVPPTGTRPTSDRVREALFSSIDSDLVSRQEGWWQQCVLDLFAGSGAFGLEALSRGAAEAIMVEKSRAAAAVIRSNAAVVGFPQAQVLVRDARQLSAVPPPHGGAGLCFADPPYDFAATDLRDVLERAAQSGWLAPGARVIVERGARDTASPFPDTWAMDRRKPYGDTVLWYGRFEDAEQPSGDPAVPGQVPGQP